MKLQATESPIRIEIKVDGVAIRSIKAWECLYIHSSFAYLLKVVYIDLNNEKHFNGLKIRLHLFSASFLFIESSKCLFFRNKMLSIILEIIAWNWAKRIFFGKNHWSINLSLFFFQVFTSNGSVQSCNAGKTPTFKSCRCSSEDLNENQE